MEEWCVEAYGQKKERSTGKLKNECLNFLMCRCMDAQHGYNFHLDV